MPIEHNQGAAASLDQSIKLRYESNPDTNAFDDAARDKLALIEGNAKDDQTGSEIRTLLAAEPDTNILTDAMVANLRTVEQFQDAVAAMLQGGTHTNVSVNYNDVSGFIDLAFTGSGGGVPLTQEQVEDFVAGVSVAGTGISVTYDDPGGSLTFALTGESFTTLYKNQLDSYSEVADPVADAIGFFDVSAGQWVYFSAMQGLTITGTTLSADVLSVVGQTGAVSAAQISTALGLGTAATTDASAYATAAQGALAQTAVLTFCLFEAGEDVASGNGAGGHLFSIPPEMNGWNLTDAVAWHAAAGSGSATTVQVHNLTQAVNMLTAPASIAAGATDSTGTDVDEANDDVATSDKIRFDVPAAASGAAQGLWVRITLQAP